MIYNKKFDLFLSIPCLSFFLEEFVYNYLITLSKFVILKKNMNIVTILISSHQFIKKFYATCRVLLTIRLHFMTIDSYFIAQLVTSIVYDFAASIHLFLTHSCLLSATTFS